MGQDYTDALKKLSTKGGSTDTILSMRLANKNKNNELNAKIIDYQSFTERLPISLAQVQLPIIIAISIDHLQELNLASSWVVGDTILYTMTDLLKQSPANSFSAKVYGGTFITLFAPGSNKDAIVWLNSIRQEFAKLKLPGLENFPGDHLTVSSGIYEYTDKTMSCSEALVETEKRLKESQSQNSTIKSTTLERYMISHPDKITFNCYSLSNESSLPTTINLIQLNTFGLSFECPQQYMEREQLAVMITVSDSTEKFEGRVVCCRSSLEGAEFPYNISVKFDSLNSGQIKMLDTLLSDDDGQSES